MRTNVNIKAINKSTNESNESIETRLSRLAATCKSVCRPTSDTQSYWFERATNPYEGKDAYGAFIEFGQLCKVWISTARVGNSLAHLASKSDVSLSPVAVRVLNPKAAGLPVPQAPAPVVPSSGVKIDNKKKNKKEVAPPIIVSPAPTYIDLSITGGDIQNFMTKDHQMARDVANILTIYTSCEMRETGGNKAAFVSGMDSAKCVRTRIFDLRLDDVRNFWPKEGASNVETRNSMYQELTTGLESADPKVVNEARGLIYCLMDMIASKANEKIRVPMTSDQVKIFNDHKPSPQLPNKVSMWKFGYTIYRKLSYADHEMAWKLYLEVRQGLGGSKANIISGYSMIDSLPGLAGKYEEALDVLNCMQTGGYSAVRLMQADVVLSELLVNSQVVVICTSNGRGIATPVPGIYASSGHQKHMIWQTIRQKSPEIKNDRVEFPNPEPFYDSDTYGYEYVPKVFDPSYKYLPSMKSADGYCIKTNGGCNYIISEKDLTVRFSMAVFTRCQYMYTRVTFPNVDPNRDFFSRQVVLKRRCEKAQEIEGLETLMLKEQAHLFTDSVSKEWDENGAVVIAPFLKTTSMATIVQDAPITGVKVTRTERLTALQAYIRRQVQGWDVAQKKKIFYEYATTNNCSDRELMDLTVGCFKVDVVGSMHKTWNFKNAVTFDSVGTCTFVKPNFWAPYLAPLSSPPLPTIEIPSSAPPPTPPDEQDPYVSQPAAVITIQD